MDKKNLSAAVSLLLLFFLAGCAGTQPASDPAAQNKRETTQPAAKMDETFRQIFYSDGFTQYCGKYAEMTPEKEPKLFYLCRLKQYSADKDGKTFISNFTVNKNTIRDLYKLTPGNTLPAEQFSKTEFISAFLNALFSIIVTEKGLGIEQLIQLQTRKGSGYIGKELDEYLYQVIKGHKEIIVANWTLIKKYSMKIDLSSTGFKAEYDKIMDDYLLIDADPKTKKQIMIFLKTIYWRK